SLYFAIFAPGAVRRGLFSRRCRDLVRRSSRRWVLNTTNNSENAGLFAKGIKVLAVTSAMGLALLGGAHAQSTLEKAQEEGAIRVGFANESPYGYATPSGELTGEAPAVAKEIFSRLEIGRAHV